MTTPLFSLQELSSVQRGNVDTVQSLANVVLEAGHKITLLNLEATRNTLQSAAHLGEDAEASRATAPYQPLAKESATYFKTLAHISAETQVELARLIQSYLSECGKQAISLLDRASKSEIDVGTAMAAVALRSAVVSATASCQNLTEATKRVTEMAQTNANALADTVHSLGAQPPAPTKKAQSEAA